ncbi:MAG: tRNA lysidine(34) synthetase TilS [Bacteroidota bacterium]
MNAAISQGPVLVAVSGGLDSAVLLDVAVQVASEESRPLAVAHVNYGLRPEADDDEQFVRARAAEYGVPAHVLNDPFDAGPNLHDRARRHRYAFFERVAKDTGAVAVLTGHHADDHAETLLLQLFRGAGLAGLASLKPTRPLGETLLVRPLLRVSRQEIETYAKARGLTWRTDTSNLDPRFARGRLRTELLPQIEALYPGSTAAIARAARHLQALDETIIRTKLTKDLDAATLPEEDQPTNPPTHPPIHALRIHTLHIHTLQTHPPAWQRQLIHEALKRFLPDVPRDAAFVERVHGLIDAQVGRSVEAGAGRVWREPGRLRFEREPQTGFAPVELTFGQSAATPLGTVSISEPMEQDDAKQEPGAREGVFVSANALPAPLLLRPWRAGDRIRLPNLGRKRISDLLSEAKIPRADRPAVCVLEAGGEIVWVPGVRVADVGGSGWVVRLRWAPSRG